MRSGKGEIRGSLFELMVEARAFCSKKFGKNAKELLLCMFGFREKVRGVSEVQKGVSVGICTPL